MLWTMFESGIGPASAVPVRTWSLITFLLLFFAPAIGGVPLALVAPAAAARSDAGGTRCGFAASSRGSAGACTAC
jgi:hypothetical protein